MSFYTPSEVCRRKKFWSEIEKELDDDIDKIYNITEHYLSISISNLPIGKLKNIIDWVRFENDDRYREMVTYNISINPHITLEKSISNPKFVIDMAAFSFIVTPKIVMNNIHLKWYFDALFSFNGNFYWKDVIMVNDKLGVRKKSLSYLSVCFCMNPNFNPRVVLRNPEISWDLRRIPTEYWYKNWDPQIVFQMGFFVELQKTSFKMPIYRKKYDICFPFINPFCKYTHRELLDIEVDIAMDPELTWEDAKYLLDKRDTLFGNFFHKIDVTALVENSKCITIDIFLKFRHKYNFRLKDFIYNPNCTLNFLINFEDSIENIIYLPKNITYRDILRHPKKEKITKNSKTIIFNHIRYYASRQQIAEELAKEHLSALKIQKRWRKIANNPYHPVGKSIITKKMNHDLGIEPLKDVSNSYYVKV